MKVMFNFPDENELEVEKQVDKTGVNELFTGLFENASLFTFRIKNLATHYEAKTVSTGETARPESFTVSSTSSVSGNTCTKTTFDGKNAVHWYANSDDKSSAWRHKRYGTMSGNTVDISNMSYLEFKLYYDYWDNPSLSNMYLQLVDTGGNVKGNMSTPQVSSTDTLAGKTYGIVVMRGKSWITIRVDLDRLKTESGFNNQVNAIKFGYNYPRNIYLTDFVFYPSSTGGQLTGLSLIHI